MSNCFIGQAQVVMGVRGLRTFISERVRVLKRTLPHGSTLVIDGDGWMFHLIQQPGEGLRMDTGGQYGEYASAIVAEIKKLQSCGLKLIVLFDGPKNPWKERTSNERLKCREEEWTSLHKFCLDQSYSRNGNSLPLAPLCKEQLMAILDQCSVRHLQCTYEADQEIALLVQQQNLYSATGIEWFAYALDTDYLIMKDCPYIEFGSVEVNDNSACAPVWSRIAVCRGLYISQEQFLDFVLFLGNDYTAPLVVHTDLYATMHRLFNGNAQIIMQEWLANVSKQRNGLLQASDLFALPPAHYNAAKRNAQMQQIWELQFAMDYSRALYHLEPLDHFYEQASQTLPPTVPYSSASCVFDFHHYSDISEGKFFADLGRYVKAAGKMGTEGVDRGVAVHALTYLKRKCASTASTSTSGPAVTEEHRAAIQVMLQQIQQPSLHDETDKLKPPPPPQWEDLLAAYVYQKTCASMLKSFPKGSFSGEHNAPVQLFNGVLFHAVLIGMRLTAGQHLPEILINERARIEPDVASSSVHSKIAVPHSEPLVVPTCAIALTKAQRKVLLSGKNNLTMPERKALLLQSMDESLSKVQRIALRKEGFSGSMTKKERIEIGIERIKRSSLTKEERKALRKQKASSKTMVPSNPGSHAPLPIFSAQLGCVTAESKVDNFSTSTAVCDLADEINLTLDLFDTKTALIAPTLTSSDEARPANRHTNTTGTCSVWVAK